MRVKMKKKNQKAVAEADGGEDLECVIHEHTLFFDKLIELIPAKFYLPTDDNEKPWFQGLSKAAKAVAKKETKENIKKSRRDRLDPEKPSATTLDLLKQSLGKEKVDDSDEEQGVVKPFMSGLEGDDRSVTYEELRQRLHRKLEGFRAGRNSAGNSDRARKREERSVRRGYEDKKRKRDIETDESKPAPDESAEKVKKDAAEASKELVFGHVKLLNEEMQGQKKRKVSKFKELEKAKKLEEEKKKDPEKVEAFAKKQSWKAAMNRASGIKVHDDPKLIQKSIHKEKKRQQKNAEKWKERVQTRDQLKAEKQQKRSENIAERSHQKKMRKIAKREKKLLRPGFEGRKEGFVNEGSG
ncbi:ribosomal RNA-processing protein 14-C [Gastrolobium bilobum]|uniref:ribosomal RNA-processing protein 14-C n=1 Tax=Gastrolobium bilobum TaxID=150636 RepID=UPI002AB1FCC6|nr:ribosomal RNA-processing protein 14-C [Gastrolobium bilobum]